MLLHTCHLSPLLLLQSIYPPYSSPSFFIDTRFSWQRRRSISSCSVFPSVLESLKRQISNMNCSVCDSKSDPSHSLKIITCKPAGRKAFIFLLVFPFKYFSIVEAVCGNCQLEVPRLHPPSAQTFTFYIKVTGSTEVVSDTCDKLSPPTNPLLLTAGQWSRWITYSTTPDDKRSFDHHSRRP